MQHCPSLYRYKRRPSRVVHVGGLAIGGTNPIRVQSMITCDTMDTEASVAQTIALAEVGCEIVRITAPTVKDAANLEHIVAGLRARKCTVPIVADIHFKPEAAMEAAKWVEKIRINPGNYADSKKFAVKEYSDAEYSAELDRIRERFAPLVKFCKEHGRAMRIGTNHGSLSDRIMNRFGDTPLGMVESALEFARIARDLSYHEFVFSMKSSNPKVMIEAYRLLVARLAMEEGGGNDSPGSARVAGDASRALNSWAYPLHLGVTEAGDGEDGRIKSAIGIGSLLSDGIGDTIRVSLTEDSVHEIPVAKALVEQVSRLEQRQFLFPENEAETGSQGGGSQTEPRAFDPFSYERRESARIEAPCLGPGGGNAGIGGEDVIRVAVRPRTFEQLAHKLDRLGDFCPDFVVREQAIGGEKKFWRETGGADNGEQLSQNAGQTPGEIGCTVLAVDPRDFASIAALNEMQQPRMVTVCDAVEMPVVAAFRLLAARLDPRHPIMLKDMLAEPVTAVGCEMEDAGGLAGNTTFGIRSASVGMSDAGSLTAQPGFGVGTGSVAGAQSQEGGESLRYQQKGGSFLENLLAASTSIGGLLCDGIGDAILVQGEEAPGQSLRLAFNILQAAGARIFKTDYVACPSCGRTLFDLQTTTARIKEATLHLKGVKIAIMGCIVNGPGEMADADFGYVGGAPGKINLYVGKKAVKFNIPQMEAVERLKDLIKEHGKWVEPAAAT